MNKTYRIGRFDLIVPSDHALDVYQSRWRLYDKALAVIADFVIDKYTDGTIMDIGANVGDSAASISSKRDIPILCVEGNPQFIPFLRTNLSKLPSCITLVEGFVGTVSGAVSVDAIKTKAGTASLAPVATPFLTDGPRVPVRTIEEILRENPRFERPALIKIDTDGSDFEILIGSIDFIRRHRPVLFFEFDPTFRKDGAQKAMLTISKLELAGYQHFIFYDNFGNFVRMISENVLTQVTDIIRYVMSHFFFGRQIYYFDVCAFRRKDEDVANRLVEFHREMIDNSMIYQGWHFAKTT